MSEDTENADTRRSSRRAAGNAKTARKSALDELRESRLSGKRHRPNLEVKDVYEMVEEDEYHRIVEGRQNDDFVVDDDGGGYVDTGADFDDDNYYNEDVDEEKKPKKKNKDKKDAKKGALDSFFTSVTSKPRRDDLSTKLKLDDDEDLQSMLAELGEDDSTSDFMDPDYRATQSTTNILSAPLNPFKRKMTESPPPTPAANVMQVRPIKKIRRETLDRTTTPKSAPKIAPKALIPSQTANIQPKVEDGAFSDDGDYGVGIGIDDLDDVCGVPDAEDKVRPAPAKKEEQAKKIEPRDAEVVTKEPKVETIESAEPKKPIVLPEEHWDVSISKVDEKPNVGSKVGSEAFYVTKTVDDTDVRAVRMYWIDAFEDVHKGNGTVYLFGRVQVGQNQWASCCLIVKNIFRQVFFLPRAQRRSNLDEDVEGKDVFDEIKKVFKRHFSTESFKCRETKKKLIKDKQFEQFSGEETDFVEVQYESGMGKLPADLTGDTFSRVFNTTTTPMERLLMEIKFMGPGWIEFVNFVEVTSKQTYCNYEFTVDMERMERKPSIEYVGTRADAPAPPVKTLAINVLTTLNEKKENEICMISMLMNSRCNLVHPSGETKDWQRMCFVTKPVRGVLPFDIKKCLEDQRMDKFVFTVPNEKALLTVILPRIAEFEPDVIVGHDLTALMSVLVSRLDKLKVANWSRISRLRRIVNIGKIGHSKAAQWELTAGRLLLDSRLAAMELVRARSYDLGELAAQLLNVQRQNMYVNDIAPMYTSSRQLLNLINWSWSDPLIALRVIVHLNALPLFLQITNIVGGVASRTLMGGRAERNEYLLLHAFHKDSLIAPDKCAFSKKANFKNEKDLDHHDGPENDNHDETNAGGKAKNKAQYLGGLVLEPKKGLYETLILLLDFNSLYPSIIQEYNLCFTTVAHTKDSDELPETPAPNQKEGVLPREIRKLVECRRDVKSMMKHSKNDGEKRQLDIRQTALKLTANSMYGCLGFQYSRFYAKPIAALVTSKGREILMHSKDLVEKMGYPVVYGDTDSIMINTNSSDIVQAKKLGFEIKKQVNKCHRLLELELDGVFKRLLLLKKKKYAALTVNLETGAEKKELKGLDIVRRDWSQLAKDAGTAVVDRILDASLSRDELVASVDELLMSMRAQLDSGVVPREKFQISKQLTRNPKEYADLKSQPHAAVAARLNDSGRFALRHGDIVEYIICDDGTANPATQRAYHRTEMESNPQLKIDLLYYLGQQIHPVVSRLCAPIEETDAVRIAEALKMDATNYRRAAAAQAAALAEEDDDVAWEPEIAYESCDPLVVTCPNGKCGCAIELRTCFDLTDPESPKCQLAACKKCDVKFYEMCYSTPICNQFDRKINEYIEKHMIAEFKCDESTCAYKTALGSLKWNREGMECPRCSGGILRKEYTNKQLFEQQMFFQSIVNVDVAEKALKKEQIKAVRADREYSATRSFCLELQEIIDEHLKSNAYNRVDLAAIFAPMCRLN